MPRTPNVVRRLTPTERRKLDELFRSPPDPRVHERALVIRLSSQGEGLAAVARVVGRGRTTIWRWIRDFNKQGLDALFMGKSPGRPARADEEVCAALLAAVESNPRDLGYPFTRWTQALLAEHIRRSVHVQLSPDTIGKKLRQNGYRYLRPKLDLKHKQDPEDVRRAKREKTVAKKKSRPPPVVMLSRFSTKRNST